MPHSSLEIVLSLVVEAVLFLATANIQLVLKIANSFGAIFELLL